jgi:hypothetical protein
MTRLYTVQLGHGLGMVDETYILLGIWQEGMSPTDLYRAALNSGLFPAVSARRLHDLIVVGFSQRYLTENGSPARFLNALRSVLSRREFEQLLFLYTCRAHAVLTDFVCQVYWMAYVAGRSVLTNEETREWVVKAVQDGKTTTQWTEGIISRVASNLTGCCADFGLLESGAKSVRTILPYRIEPRTAAFLAYDLHGSGLGDNAVLAHPDWALFGLERMDVLEELKKLARKGLLIVQAAGGVTKISWQLASMEALIHVLARNELR